MKKILYIIFFIFISFIIKNYYSSYIIVSYDKKTNIIIYNNKKYYQISNENDTIKYNLNLNQQNNNNTNIKNNITNQKFLKYSLTKSESDLSKLEIIIYSSAAVLITTFAGIMSGLTVGFMGISPIVLEIHEKNGTAKEKRTARRILNILNKHHWLLVTLLLCNSFASETIPIVLNKLFSEIYSIFISAISLLIVGEIIPMALCTGPMQMKLVTCFYPLVYFLMIVTYVLSMPFALIMDKVIGKQETTRFNNEELKEMIRLHDKSNFNKDSENLKANIGLNKIQIKLIENVIDLSDKKINDIMKNYNVMKKYEKNEEINDDKKKNIQLNKQENIPIYEDNIHNVVGVLNSIELLNTENINNFNELKLDKPLFINENNNIFEVIEKFILNEQKMSFILKEIDLEELSQKSENDQQVLLDNDNNRNNDDNLISNNDENKDKLKFKEKILGVVYLNDIFKILLDNIKEENNDNFIQNENDMVLIVKEN
jgi:CBS domain containing-hemolysin-like protein